MTQYGPQTEFSEKLHAQKHRGPGETFKEAMTRIASTLTSSPDEFKAVREMLLQQRFLPAGRIQTAVGSTRNVTPYNCFVSGTIEDSFVDDHGSIMDRAKEAAQTMRMGGGIGYDFSTLRPRGAEIHKLGSTSSGPMAFMDIFDAICRAVASSGHRRGAQMGVMRVDHPDIEEFVRAKHNGDRLTGFNVSVGITDEFMHAVEAGDYFSLRFNGKTYRRVDARTLWNLIMRSTWDWAEPGVLFLDTIERMNNLHYCEEISATNPCGEQPLPPFGACLLGSFNLVKYLNLDNQTQWFNYELFRHDVVLAVRSMDLVIDVATYPLPKQRDEAHNKRRMGLGVTGLANALEAVGFQYGGSNFLEATKYILTEMRDMAYTTSVQLAKERGRFPLFDRDEYLKGEFIATLPEEVQDAIAEHGIRNSHLLSIAPTGTISLCADNVSSGIEPVFDYEVERTIIGPDGPETHHIQDYGLKFLGRKGRVASEVTVQEHLDVLCLASRFVDSAVSKTLNVPSDTPWEDFKGIYHRAWKAGCKGCTTYQVGGKREPVIRSKVEGGACSIDPSTGARTCE